MAMNRALLKVITITHRLFYRLSGGAIGARLAGRGNLLLTTTGRKTGKQRTIPLLYMPDGDNLVIVGSNGASPRHPDWWLNLERNPEAEVQVGQRRVRARAEKAEGEERARLWALLLEMYPPYAEYQQAVEREIPVVVLRPQ